MSEYKIPWIIAKDSVPAHMRRASRKEKVDYLTCFYSDHSPSTRVMAAMMAGLPARWRDGTINSWLLIHRNHLTGSWVVDENKAEEDIARAKSIYNDLSMDEILRWLAMVIINAAVDDPSICDFFSMC